MSSVLNYFIRPLCLLIVLNIILEVIKICILTWKEPIQYLPKEEDQTSEESTDQFCIKNQQASNCFMIQETHIHPSQVLTLQTSSEKTSTTYTEATSI